jgi:hypothetical protein
MINILKNENEHHYMVNVKKKLIYHKYTYECPCIEA